MSLRACPIPRCAPAPARSTSGEGRAAGALGGRYDARRSQVLGDGDGGLVLYLDLVAEPGCKPRGPGVLVSGPIDTLERPLAPLTGKHLARHLVYLDKCGAGAHYYHDAKTSQGGKP